MKTNKNIEAFVDKPEYRCANDDAYACMAAGCTKLHESDNARYALIAGDGSVVDCCDMVAEMVEIVDGNELFAGDQVCDRLAGTKVTPYRFRRIVSG